jgi:endonuclease YncB( thermonuclease family)
MALPDTHETRRPARPDSPLRRRRVVVRTGVVLTVALLGAMDHAGLLLAAPDDAPRMEGRWARLVEVLDFRTLEVAVEPAGAGAQERVTLRLLGLAAYANAAEQARFEPGAVEALREALSGGALVGLEPHARRARWRDPAGRLTTAAGEDAAAGLIRRGLARAATGAAHSMARAHQKAEITARRTGSGLWEGEGAEAPGP